MSENRQRDHCRWRTLVSMWNDEARYAVIKSRDPRYDGEFFTAVTSTGIYCRPSCPARTPSRANVRFYPSAAAAADAGFRACKRCLPDAVPGSARWSIGGDLAARAMRLIDDGVVDREGVEGLAARLGYSSRQVARVLTAELGAGPVSLAQAHRLHHARALLEGTSMPVAQVAHAAGFGSVRRLNEAAATRWGRSPSQVRALTSGSHAARDATQMSVSLAYRGQYDWERMLAHLGARAIAGVERVEGRAYTRTLVLPHGPAVVTVEPGRKALAATLSLTDPRDLPAAVSRLRRLLDLDADLVTVREALASDATLAPLIAAAPWLRVPGAVDGFELAVRAIVGQQVSVAGARTTLATIVARFGAPVQGAAGWLTFPGPEALIEADPGMGLIPRSRWLSIHALAVALVEGRLDLGPGASRDDARRTLLGLPGIGPWTAEYIALRALHDPDAFPAGDSVLRQTLGTGPASADRAGEAWRPWRAYAAQHVWTAASEGRA